MVGAQHGRALLLDETHLCGEWWQTLVRRVVLGLVRRVVAVLVGRVRRPED